MDIFINQWTNVTDPKGIIQIFHGMAEHGKRYEEFANYLNQNGFLVFADDHRGHGKTAIDTNNLGNIGENGFLKIVEDEIEINKSIKEEYPNIPIYIFAHSFGSFIGQEFLIQYGDNIDGLILSGSGYRKGLDLKAGILIAKVEKFLFNKNHKSIFLDKVSFFNFNKKALKKDSKFSWLTSDPCKVLEYENDPLCGFVFTSSSFYYLFKGINEIFNKKRFIKVNKDLPILFLSGDLDPVGRYGKKVYKLFDFYKSLSFKNISLLMYKNGGHEMVNEINRDEVYSDIIKWLNNIKV